MWCTYIHNSSLENRYNVMNYLKFIWNVSQKILLWTVVVAFSYSLFFTQERIFVVFVCLMLIAWFFVEYFRINQASNHARKKYDLYDPELWKLEKQLEQRFMIALGWAFLGGLSAMSITLWKALH